MSLYEGLQNIAETFKDAVPVDYTGLPVIRYTAINKSPSLSGDDKFIHLSGTFQIDVYDRYGDAELIKAVTDYLRDNYYRITNIQDTEEEGIKRTIFDIKIEE